MLILKSARAVDWNPPRVQEHADIVIEKDTILAVGPNAALSYYDRADHVIDCGGKIVHPGLVCSHHHYYSGLSRGVLAEIGPTPDFISILKQLWWRLDRSLTDEDIYWSSMICSIDALKCGTTAVIDHHASPGCIPGSLDHIRRGFEETGLRGMTCYEVTDRNNGAEEAQMGIEENIRFARTIDRERKEGTWSGLCEAAVGAHAPFTVTDEALEGIADAIAQTGRGIHIHVAEDRYDVSHSHHYYGKDLIRRLDDAGVINEKALLVHGVHLSEAEIELINERDAFLIHNARSNMNNGIGYNGHLPGVKHAVLGTDGIGANMFEEFKIAFFKHKDASGSLWPDDFTRMLSGGNRILERYFNRPFGVIEPGYAADLVISDYLSPTPLEAENIAGHMAFGMGAQDVRTVIVNGKIVMEDRSFSLDVEQVYRKAAEAAKRLWKYMDTLSAR